MTQSVKDKMEQRSRLEKQRDSNTAEVRAVDDKVGKLEKAEQVASKQIDLLINDNPWILQEQAFFNSPDSHEYKDLDKMNIAQRKIDYQRLTDQVDKLKNQVNPHVNEQHQHAEEEYNELIKKRDKMVCDKAEIAKQIDKLDILKNQTLDHTFNIVSSSFSKIFATLLPGAQAEL